MDALDAAIGEAGASAFVIYASSSDANMRYLTGFVVGDPVVYIRRPKGRGLLIVPQMEFERAGAESYCEVMTRGDAGFFEIHKEESDPWKVVARMIARQVEGEILVPARFPLALARALEAHCRVRVNEGVVESMRAVKSSRELAEIRRAQVAAEGAMDFALTMIRKAKPKGGKLLQEGVSLTSEAVRKAIAIYLLERGYRTSGTIVSCGIESAMPHHLGSGDLLEGEPIVIDLFPQHEETGYYADMTRTVVYGEPDPAIVEMYAAVRDAQDLARSLAGPRISGAELHQAVRDLFTERGFETGTEGFIHSLGHGIGLDVHEKPALAPSGEALLPGQVVTLEPGLYYQKIGGVRLEDLGVITQQGFDLFTNYPRELAP
ncbi:MAG: Xaa-Pro peptidase family protein [Methanomicrobiaceae archaeon]|nr:Xaa-Pro peptidase family protein [Methanomicrobiaceae archaeon]